MSAALYLACNADLQPFHFSRIWESYLHDKYDFGKCVYESIKGKNSAAPLSHNLCILILIIQSLFYQTIQLKFTTP